MPEVRLIDANALKAKLKIDTNTATYSDYCNGYCDARQVDLDAIDAAPTIEPEVRHGQWKGWTTSKFTGKYKDYDEPEFKDYVYYTCSECYRKSAIQELYCPNCGARMDGGADNG